MGLSKKPGFQPKLDTNKQQTPTPLQRKGILNDARKDRLRVALLSNAEALKKAKNFANLTKPQQKKLLKKLTVAQFNRGFGWQCRKVIAHVAAPFNNDYFTTGEISQLMQKITDDVSKNKLKYPDIIRLYGSEISFIAGTSPSKQLAVYAMYLLRTKYSNVRSAPSRLKKKAGSTADTKVKKPTAAPRAVPKKPKTPQLRKNAPSEWLRLLKNNRKELLSALFKKSDLRAFFMDRSLSANMYFRFKEEVLHDGKSRKLKKDDNNLHFHLMANKDIDRVTGMSDLVRVIRLDRTLLYEEIIKKIANKYGKKRKANQKVMFLLGRQANRQFNARAKMAKMSTDHYKRKIYNPMVSGLKKLVQCSPKGVVVYIMTNSPTKPDSLIPLIPSRLKEILKAAGVKYKFIASK